jgi:hypothetical protein
MGFDWPLSPVWLALGTFVFLLVLFFHGRALLHATVPRFAWKLIGLRALAGGIFLLLLVRPYLETDEPATNEFRLLALADLSGSMDVRDDRGELKRIEQVRPHLDWTNSDSWLSQQMAKYGKVEKLGFAQDASRLRSQAWRRPELGEKTALGDVLDAALQDSEGQSPLGSVVVFTDGRNNSGRPVLEVAKDYRVRGVPVNVVGVGKIKARGDLSVRFSDRKPKAVAKEELLLKCEVANLFSQPIESSVRLFLGKKVLEEIPLKLKAGETRGISFSPLKPKSAGPQRYRIEIVTPSGDADPSNDVDSLLVLVKPPDRFLTLYLSNRVQPLYPFVKRVLVDEERFEFRSIIRMSEKVFHAFGDEIKPGYPEDSSFWMDYDAVILDMETLTDLNATLVDSLKDFVQKKGGGLLLFGPTEKGRELLGGLVPAKEVERVLAKDNLSLVTLEEPLFRPEDDVDEMRPFMPGRLPGFFVKKQNPAARGVVVSRANGRSVLSVQAYGAGKVGYWGVPHDWRRSMSDEDGAREFRKFWQALVQWLGTGGEDRLKIEENEKPFLRGGETPLRVEALGSDFEPSMDAMVKARVTGPDGFEKTVQLYPEGSAAGRYAGSFRPTQPGAYEVHYELTFPDGEALERESYLRVSESGEEAIDVSYAERDLKMLAKLTGGEFLPVSKLNDGWEPAFAEILPIIQKRHSLADAWLFFIVLFLVAGIEWVMRRQVGLR